MNIDADPNHGVADARDLGIEFREDPAEFARAEEQIVGPAQIGLERRYSPNRIVDGEACRER